MNEALEEKISEWLKWDKDEKTRHEIMHLKDTNDTVLLSKLLLARLNFGTAGLRGRMGAGYSQMNDLVIIQTTQGLCSYLIKYFTKEKVEQQGVCIGYDGRHNSKRFAELTAAIFVNSGIPVYFYSTVCPTPFVPFTLCYYKCVCGIMITASHNPKDDNGYKVFGENGAQIVSPFDKHIQESIVANLAPWEKSWDITLLRNSPLFQDPSKEIESAYYQRVASDSLLSNINSNTNIQFTYSPMHGVGYPFMVKAFETAKFKPFVVVEEQRDPDPEFPTVKFPNPEEGKSALNLSFETANSHNSSVILANDPDADRLAVAEKMENGEWYVFSGNEIGALLGWWSLFNYKTKNPDSSLKDVYMLSSTVSSKILQSMSNVEGFSFVETLTGFKWMGNRAYELIQDGKTVLFAYEEAIGFMFGTAVLDKDGISAGVHMAQLASYLATKNMSIKKKLQDIYMKYGHHLSMNSYYLCYDPTTVNHIFSRLRSFKGSPKTYPDNLMEGKYSIIGIRDLTTGYDSSEPDSKTKLPTSSSSHMITFTFDNGLVATLRTSGTEPKIKYYTELCQSEEKDVNKLSETLTEMVDALVNEFLQPELNSLIPPD